MRFEVNIDKKYFFAIVLIGLVFIGIVGVIAYNSNPAVPSNFGHSVNEIEWSQTISGNVKAAGFCIGSNCVTDWSTLGGNGGGVTRIIAGPNITMTSTGSTPGTGNVTISAAGGGGGGVGVAASETQLGGVKIDGNTIRINGYGQIYAYIGTGAWATSPAGNIFSTNTGNVGIGTMIPGQKLTVVGNANITGNLTVNGVAVGGSSSGSLIYLCPRLANSVSGYAASPCPSECIGQLSSSAACNIYYDAGSARTVCTSLPQGCNALGRLVPAS